jgi:hypothetical protein
MGQDGAPAATDRIAESARAKAGMTPRNFENWRSKLEYWVNNLGSLC